MGNASLRGDSQLHGPSLESATRSSIVSNAFSGFTEGRGLSLTAIVSAVFFTGESVVANSGLVFDNDGIVGFANVDDLPIGTAVIDAGGCRVCPGLIDLQVNGSGAYNCSTFADARDALTLGAELASTGTTRWAPTVLSRPMDRSLAIAELVGPIADDAGIIALHIEGPWLNPEKAGAHTLSRLCAPTASDLVVVELIAETLPTIVTLAPECVPNALLTQMTRNPRVRVMLAHSTADFDATARFLDGGGAGITHVFNTMNGVLGRMPGPMPALIGRRGKYASVIADGVHVHAATLAMLKRSLDPDALFLVSDLIWNAFREESKHDRVLAGSNLSLCQMVAFCVTAVGISIDEALRMATLYPARFLGVGDRFGMLAPGYAADMIGITDEFELRFAIRNGQLIWDAR